MYWAWYVKLYCAWSSFLQNWDRRIINKIYYYYCWYTWPCTPIFFWVYLTTNTCSSWYTWSHTHVLTIIPDHKHMFFLVHMTTHTHTHTHTFFLVYLITQAYLTIQASTSWVQYIFYAHLLKVEWKARTVFTVEQTVSSGVLKYALNTNGTAVETRAVILLWITIWTQMVPQWKRGLWCYFVLHFEHKW